jgi:hypothetical protein
MKIGSKNCMVRSHRLLSLVLVAIGFGVRIFYQ